MTGRDRLSAWIPLGWSLPRLLGNGFDLDLPAVDLLYRSCTGSDVVIRYFSFFFAQLEVGLVVVVVLGMWSMFGRLVILVDLDLILNADRGQG